ncbi:MAG: hypothetical protein J1F66_04325 [Clostridiales bacterium]|nr:hypothetical protein [Clostridiales bacterium]
MMDTKKLLTNILLKKAKGYAYHEKTDEYNVVDGKKQLVKSKVVTKRVQPDVNAIKALISLTDASDDVTQMTDEQLQVEKLRLLNLLNNYQNSPIETPNDGDDEN